MNITTIAKRSALVVVLGLSAAVAGAQTFCYDGVIYKVATGSNLTVQKAGTAVTTGAAGPSVYSGDIVIPDEIVFEGKTYTPSNIGTVFKANQNITSIKVGVNVLSLSRGAFQGDSALVKVELPSTMNKWTQGDQFNGCKSLKEINIPGGVATIASNNFKGCVSLEKLIIEQGATPLDITILAFGDGGTSSLKEVVVNRAMGTKYATVADAPFRNAKLLEKVTIGGSMLEVPSSFFSLTPMLNTVTFTNQPTKLGTDVFANSGIAQITLPESITTIPSGVLANCPNLTKVTLGSAVTSIADLAMVNSPIAEINLPTSLTSIGQMAFSGANLAGTLTLPSALSSVGIQAFANNAALTAVEIPASLTNIGDGAFKGCTGVASYKVAAENSAYQSVDDKYILSADGKTLITLAPASDLASLSDANITAVKGNAAYGAHSLTSVSLPNCKEWGDYAFANTGLTEIEVSGIVGRYVAADNAALLKAKSHGSEVPFGFVANCPALTQVVIADPVTTIKQDAFKGCTALKSLNLGNVLSIIEADAFTGAGVDELTVAAANPAAMTEGVFTAANSNITCKVPVAYADAYKNAAGWKFLNIVGDANVAAGPNDMGMPAGLYYAGTDGNIHCVYESGEPSVYDLGGLPHTFQLSEFKNRIYGASAGQKFVYSNTGSVDGDGKLFYMSQIGGQPFQAVVLDNTGGNAYKDPFSLSFYGNDIFVNDRNVCIRKVSAESIALNINYPSWCENTWLPFYGSPWAYGCIKAGWAITQDKDAAGNPEPLYWQGFKFNGNGIFRFKESDIKSDGSQSPSKKRAGNEFLTNIAPIFTTFYIDEPHNQMYIYFETAGKWKNTADSTSTGVSDAYTRAGLYRIDIDKLTANPEPEALSALDIQLIDGSPVKYEGSGTNEHVGISQLCPDANGEYLYWCYRAPSQSEADATEARQFNDMKTSGHYWWADKFDATNPLHQSGIKRIKLGEANPTVEMVKAGVEGYGCVPVNYAGSVAPSEGVENITVAPAQGDVNLMVSGDELIATADAKVYVYNAAGTIVAYATLADGQALSIANLAKGAYVATANGRPLKFVK